MSEVKPIYFGVQPEHIQAQNAHNRFIFGKYRFPTRAENYARLETVDAFCNMVMALCAESSAIEMSRDLRIRKFGQDSDKSLMLSSNTAPFPSVHPDPMFDGPASAFYLRTERVRKTDRLYRMGTYAVSDSIYIEAGNERAMLRREMVREGWFGRSGAPLEGKLPATESEVRSALDTIHEALLAEQPFDILTH